MRYITSPAALRAAVYLAGGIAALLMALGPGPVHGEQLVAMTQGKAFIGVPQDCEVRPRAHAGTRRCVVSDGKNGFAVTLDEFVNNTVETFGNAAPDPLLGVNYEMSFGFDEFAMNSVGGNRAFIREEKELQASALPKGVTACIRYVFDQTSDDGSQRVRELGLYCATADKNGKGGATTTIAAVAWITTEAATAKLPAGFDSRAKAILSTFKRN